MIKCSKSKVLFGLDKTLPYIKRLGVVYVFESEKAVMQMWSNGIRNCVAVGSHKISKAQSRKLTHLGVDIVFCYDDKVGILWDDEKRTIPTLDFGKYVIDNKFWKHEFRNFINGQRVGIMWDYNKILNDKDSPSDDFEKWKILKEDIRWRIVKKES